MRKFMVIALALTMVFGMTTLASAKIKVNGDLRTEFDYSWANEEYNGEDDTFGLDWFNNSYSRIKFSYLSDDKKFQAYVEQGIYSKWFGNTTPTRQAWMQYNWNNGSIRIGQAYSILAKYGSHQVSHGYTGLIGYGYAYYSRFEQIRLTLGSKYKMQFAIENPHKTGIWNAGNYYYYLPALSLSFDLNFGNVSVNPWVHYENIQGQNVSAAGNDDSYDNFDVGLGLTGDFGLVGFTANVHYGMNSSISDVPVSANPSLDINGEADDDSHVITAMGELRIGGLAVGYGYVRSTRDDWANDPYKQSVYANYTIPFGMMTFQPHISYFDEGEDENGNDEGDYVVFGVMCRMKF